MQSNYSHSQMPYRSNPNQLGDQPRPPQSVSQATSVTHGQGMSELDRWGLPGLVERLQGNEGQDHAAIALGMDLNTLGLDLNRPE